ncbi:MAG TPA: IclR family transcriptional regulator [Kineosporiaceae bacterium]|nr:IclR family transcriptional regulator [Kineosporiaceae bacterium]
MRSAEWDGAPASVLERAISLLDAFGADRTELGISELSRRCGLAKSTTHRLAGELVRLGLLEQADGRVRLGMHLFELGQLVPRQRTLKDAAIPYMEDLREATQNNVHLAVLDGIEVVYVEIMRVRDSQPLPSRVGGRMPAHATGVGKAILAFSPPEVVKARIEAGLTRRSPFTIIMPGALARELRTIAETGVSYDRQESAVGIVCAAAPVFGADGRIAAAISVTGRAERLDVERMSPAVRTAALALSRALGGQLPPRD